MREKKENLKKTEKTRKKKQKKMSVLAGFNYHFIEFVTVVAGLFPDNKELQAALTGLGMIRKANPKMIIKIWREYVVDKYSAQIDSGDLSFFIEKDYSQDLANADNSSQIMQSINQLRSPIQAMSKEDQSKTVKYIQNLKVLCNLYYQ